ncbi:MAG: pyruvate formate lyase-activating protein [Clostridia bacterium]|nr:pyruvate formate lyase-activating protein [Clostridia bacterium]
MTGRISSFQSLGTLDGPGVRFVAFLQGCDLACGCCHNPETRGLTGGQEFTPAELLERVKRFKEYFGDTGGLTLSGGEPLLQPEFVAEVFALCKNEGINTCLDTAGVPLTESVRAALEVTDRVLLDIKYTNDEDYIKYAGCSISRPLEFLEYLKEREIPVTLRQVIIPTLNDSRENVLRLAAIRDEHKNVDKIELLPFKKLCATKYEALGIKFPFGHLPTPTAETMAELSALL